MAKKTKQTKTKKTKPISEASKESVAPIKEPTQFQRVIGTHKRNDKPVASVMTEGASEMIDVTRKEGIIYSAKNPNIIHKPRG